MIREKREKKDSGSKRYVPPSEGPARRPVAPGRAFSLWKKKDGLALFIIGLSTFILYASTLNYPFHFDDSHNIVENPYIKQLGNLSLFKEGLSANKTWHRAIPAFTFAVNYRLHGLKVWGYRLFNVLLHLGSGILVYFISKHLLGLARKRREPAGPGDPGSRFHDFSLPLFAALIFVVHPIQVNTVTYIVQRNEGMAAFFYLLGLLLFIKGSFSRGLSKALFFGGAGVIFFAAILSKEIGFTLPVMIMIFDLLFVCKDREGLKRRLWIYGPILLLLVFFILFFLREGIYAILFSHAHFWTPWENLLTQANVLIQYIKLLFLPWPGWLNIDHEFDIARSVFAYPTFLSILALAGLLCLSLLRIKKNPLLSFGILWFFIVLAPTSSLIPIWDIMVEYRLYLPMFIYGLILAAVAGYFTRIVNQRVSKEWGRYIIPGAMVFLLLIYSVFTAQRNGIFKDGMSLWQDALRKSPNKIRPYLNVGGMHHRERRYAEAIEIMKKALEKEPRDYYLVHFTLGVVYSDMGDYEKGMAHLKRALQGDQGDARIHQELGTLYLRMGSLEEAGSHFNRVLEINPYLGPAHAGLGDILARQGRLEEAAMKYRYALRLEPDLSKVRIRLGEAYLKMGKSREALSEIKEAMAKDPGSQEAYASLGAVYLQEGKIEEALPLLEKALAIHPGNPEICNNLGAAYRFKEQLDEAIRYYRMAIELDPQFLDARINLGEAYDRKGMAEEAMAEYQKSLSIDPRRAEPYNHLGVLYLRQGRAGEAISSLSKAVSLNPGYGEAHYNLAMAYFRKRLISKAAEHAEKAVQLGYPVNPKFLQILSPRQ